MITTDKGKKQPEQQSQLKEIESSIKGILDDKKIKAIANALKQTDPEIGKDLITALNKLNDTIREHSTTGWKVDIIRDRNGYIESLKYTAL